MADMTTWVALSVGAIAVLLVLYAMISVFPEIRRYWRMRHM